jgi:hypothetical protein
VTAGELAGVDLDRFPLLAERLAIDLTDALRAADSGLQALRGRPALRRFWEGLTGIGQRRQAAIGQDLLTAQQAMLGVVRELLQQEARTQYCVHRVLVNLRAVNQDLDAAADRLDAVDAQVGELRAALAAVVRDDIARLDARVAALHSEVRREGAIRRLAELYRAGELHPGMSPALDAAMMIASVMRHFWGASRRRRDDEAAAALALARQRLGARPLPLEEALLSAVEDASDEARAAMLPACGGTGPCLAVVVALAERRQAGLPNSELNAADAIAIARVTRAPARLLSSRLVRPAELAHALAVELAFDDDEPAAAGSDNDEEVQWTPSRARSR